MKSLIKLLLLFALLSGTEGIRAQANAIRINQMGYYPDANKIAVIVFTSASNFEVINLTDNSVAYSGNLSAQQYWADAGDSVKRADFSNLSTPGKYKLRIPGFGESYPFEISKNVLRKAAYASLKSFYYQRSSFKLEPEYAGLWSRNAGHPDTACILHVSTGKSGIISSPGGWYDAGDYGKYVINAGISVATLLSFYENFNYYFADESIHIPESGNGENDLLDEVKFELDWLKTMQDSDGGVFFKLTTLAFSGFVMPDADKASRYVIGKTTASALDFAAMMAMAGRIYKDYDSNWAADCIIRADSAWKWAKANPSIYFKNPSDVSTGEYGDNNVSDEFIWAAAELYITTGGDEFKTYLENKSSSLNYYSAPGWPSVQPLASLSLLSKPNGLSASILTSIKNTLLSTCDKWLGQITSSPCRIPQFGYGWGSNAQIANYGVGMIYAWLQTRDPKYAKGAAECADYLLGKNGTGFSFESGYGSKTPMNFHHRPSSSDGIIQPVPGFVSGGPNPGKEDGQLYPFSQPAKCFVDITGSYASNEVCINWNSPLTALLAGVDAILGDSASIDFEVLNQANNPPSLSISSPGLKVGNDAPLTINCVANDPDGISRIEIYMDSRYKNSLMTSPYQYTLDTLPPGDHTVTLLAMDSNGLSTEKSSNFRYYAVHHVPGRIETEDYFTNSGMAFQKTSDIGGGNNVTSIDANDYIDYSVIVETSGPYRADFRVASSLGNGQFQLKSLSNTIFSTMSVNATGGSQKWITITDTINLNAGKQTIRLLALKGGWNINWINFEPVVETVINAKSTFTENSVIIAPNPAAGNFTVYYHVKNLSPIEFRMYDLNGRLVAQQKIEQMQERNGSVQWKNLHNLIPGEYIIAMFQQGVPAARQTLIIKKQGGNN